MQVFIVLLVLFAGAVICGLLEFKAHQKRVLSIPIRIHVNGTRGKSSVTRLIGAGLNAGGIKTITKVTGTFPRLILEDGTEAAIYRKGQANIIEQLSIIKFAAQRNVNALVIECMALEPQFQWITENQMIHATVGVMTNVRPDHLDIMGYTLPEIAATLGRSIPKNKILFTAEKDNPQLLKTITDKLHTELIVTEQHTVTDYEMSDFSYIEHKENVALALVVCEHLGVERTIALNGMYAVNPDPGALVCKRIHDEGKEIILYNAFAANDPQSTLMIWKRLQSENRLKGTKILLLNTRHDRLDRARQLAEMTGREINNETDYLILIGHSSETVEHICVNSGFEKKRIVNLGWTNADHVYETILSLTEKLSTVAAIGNIGGMGNSVVERFEKQEAFI